MILGTGNVLGYDRKGRNQFVINPEQAETVKRISDIIGTWLAFTKI